MRAALAGLLALLGVGCADAGAGQLRSVDGYKFSGLAAGCWTAVGSAEETIGWQQVCFGTRDRLVVLAQHGRRTSAGSFSIEADKLVIEAPIAGERSSVQVTCDAVVRPYSGLALRHCDSAGRSFTDVEFSYDDDKAAVLLGCWQRVDDDIFPESICFEPGDEFETSVFLPDAREGFGSPGKYSFKAGRLRLETDYPYEGWLWEDSPRFSCEVKLADPRHLEFINCDPGVKPTKFSRGEDV